MIKGSLVWQSRTAEVFAWEDNRVLKLFRNSEYALDVLGKFPAEQEVRNTLRVRQAGLTVPDVKGIIKVDRRPGIIYERIDGPTMWKKVRTRPWTFVHSARILAEMHAAIHTYTVPKLPSQRRQLEIRIRAATLPASVKEAALKSLGELPDDNMLCHGDFQPKNILMSSHGPIIVDWIRASQGNPIADVANTLVLLRLSSMESVWFGRWLIEAPRDLFRYVYLTRYLQLRPNLRDQIAAWLLPVAVARLRPGAAHKRKLLALVEASLAHKA